MIERIMDQQRKTYIANLKESIVSMKELLKEFSHKSNADLIDDFRRYFHTIRGTAQTLHIKGLGIIGTRYDAGLTRLAEKDAEADEYIKVLEEGFTEVQKELDRYDGNQEELGQAGAKEEDSGETGLVLSGAASNDPENETAASILMLDDDQTLLEQVKRVLEKDGFNVYITSEYEDAEKILREVSVDLFLLDLYLKNVNGFEVLNHMKAQGIRTPTVVCTGDSTAASREMAIAAGALDLIVKPFKTSEMAALVRFIIKRSSIKGVE
jgi:CheY-like chemotaxis protein